MTRKRVRGVTLDLFGIHKECPLTPEKDDLSMFVYLIPRRPPLFYVVHGFHTPGIKV